jgi:hypothetical protein
MLSLTKRLHSLTLTPFLSRSSHQLRSPRPDASSHSRRRHKSPPLPLKKAEERSEWWIVDGEMHEIGDHVPPRERFVIPRENIPNKRRKQLREQFMRRTRLVLKESVSPYSLIFDFSFFFFNVLIHFHFLCYLIHEKFEKMNIISY